MLSLAAIVPHPTAIIPGLKNDQKTLFSKTFEAFKKLGEKLTEADPKTIIIISPHGPMRYDKFTINLESRLQGGFADFDSDINNLDFRNNAKLSKELFGACRSLHLPVDLIRESELDYASLLPLYYLTRNWEKKPQIIPLTYTMFDYRMHYVFGKAIGKIAEKNRESIAFLSSGDLSHRLQEDSPAGFSLYGEKFDKTLISLLENNQVEKILGLNPEFAKEAEECGLKSILITLGALTAVQKANFQKLVYEAPLGVGHLIGYWELN